MHEITVTNVMFSPKKGYKLTIIYLPNLEFYVSFIFVVQLLSYATNASQWF